MVVIEPTGPKQIAWLRAAAYGLSPREREVVELVARGASRKQISATLYISECRSPRYVRDDVSMTVTATGFVFEISNMASMWVPVFHRRWSCAVCTSTDS